MFSPSEFPESVLLEQVTHPYGHLTIEKSLFQAHPTIVYLFDQPYISFREAGYDQTYLVAGRSQMSLLLSQPGEEE